MSETSAIGVRTPAPAVRTTAATAQELVDADYGVATFEPATRIETGPEFWRHGLGDLSAEVHSSQTVRYSNLLPFLRRTQKGVERVTMPVTVMDPSQLPGTVKGALEKIRRGDQATADPFFARAASQQSAIDGAKAVSKALYLAALDDVGPSRAVPPFVAVLSDGTDHYVGVPVIKRDKHKHLLQPWYEDSLRRVVFTRHNPAVESLESLAGRINFAGHGVSVVDTALVRHPGAVDDALRAVGRSVL